jgi:hypothetical protein
MVIDRKQLKVVTGSDIYDGSVIHNRFAYKFLRDKVQRTGDIVAFVAPMEVTDNLIDLEDSINNDFIYSENAINFIMEIPDICLFGGVAFQRLFNTHIGSFMSRLLGMDVSVQGDDIFVREADNDDVKLPNGKKASVSIATQVNNAVLIHTGVNINAGVRAPSFACSTFATPEEQQLIMEHGIALFHNMTKSMFKATTKVI